LIRSAAQSYLLDSGIYWGAAPMVKVCSINLKHEIHLCCGTVCVPKKLKQ